MNVTKIHKAVFKKGLLSPQSIKYEQICYNKFDSTLVSFKVVKQSYGLAKVKPLIYFPLFKVQTNSQFFNPKPRSYFYFLINRRKP